MNRTARTLLVLVVAVAAAGAASFAVYRAVQRMPVRQVEVAQMQVAVAAAPIPVGTVVTKDMVKLVGWPSNSPVAGSFAAADAVAGRAALVSIAENEPITEPKLASKEAGGGLSPTIPAGMRAMSVKVNEVIGVAGFTVPGTRVDVLATIGKAQQESATRTVVSNVLVLTAGTRYDQEAPKKDGKPIPTTVVTLAVLPADAERIALAQAEGQIMLALRNPLDDQPTLTPGVRLAALMAPPGGPPVEKTVKGRKVVVASKPVPVEPAQRIYTVEAIRGAKRTEETVK
jgi:pilus assembly protein CpaB